jgi:hypothetical protein
VDGQEINPDTAGHCCWPGQVWSGGKCIGVPTRCPADFERKSATQTCERIPCPPLRVRMSDGAHCCWPKQAWSQVRDTCVGVPECPAGFEVVDETCTSDDLDQDGIKNAADRCAEVPEDRDGFRDEDGCPDVDDDGDGVNDGEDGCRTQAEDPDHFKDDDGCPEADNDSDGVPDGQDGCANDPEDRNGLKDDDGCPDEPERLAGLAAEENRKASLVEQQRQRVEDAAAADSRRIAGFVCLAGAGVGGVLMGAFLGLGAARNGAIRDGGFATASDIQAAADEGATFNEAAIGSGIVGGALLTTGVILLLTTIGGDEDIEEREANAQLHLLVEPGGMALYATW